MKKTKIIGCNIQISTYVQNTENFKILNEKKRKKCRQSRGSPQFNFVLIIVDYCTQTVSKKLMQSTNIGGMSLESGTYAWGICIFFTPHLSTVKYFNARWGEIIIRANARLARIANQGKNYGCEYCGKINMDSRYWYFSLELIVLIL